MAASDQVLSHSTVEKEEDNIKKVLEGRCSVAEELGIERVVSTRTRLKQNDRIPSPLAYILSLFVLVFSLIFDKLNLLYYQYEANFGVYMLQPIEKVITNTIVMLVLGGICVGIKKFISKYIIVYWL